jgi:membrane-bound ClpP family serine protease
MSQIIILTLVGYLAIIFDLLFIPGGVFIIAGIAGILYAIFLTAQEFGFMAAGIHFVVCLAIAPKLVAWSFSRVALRSEMKASDGYVATKDHSAHIGSLAVAFSDMRPSGKIQLPDGALLDGISDGGYFEKGTSLIVIDAQSHYLVVAKESSKPVGRKHT